jgi:hypothetical protein
MTALMSFQISVGWAQPPMVPASNTGQGSMLGLVFDLSRCCVSWSPRDAAARHSSPRGMCAVRAARPNLGDLNNGNY